MKFARLLAMPVLAIALSWPGSLPVARAQDASASPCAGSPTEAAMLACHEKEFAKAQADLEDLVKELRTNYAYDGSEHTDALDLAQEKWKAFAGAECDLLTYDSRGGTAFDVYVLKCLTRLHARRIAEIQALLDSP
jgi:uncharacterized protein YecT (DUF1311 family)